MKNFIIEMFSSGGKVSSKRVVTMLAFVIMAAGFLVDLLSDKSVTESIYTSMEYIVIAGLGFTASERFAKPKKEDEEQN